MQGKGHTMAAREKHTKVNSCSMGKDLAVTVLPSRGAGGAAAAAAKCPASIATGTDRPDTAIQVLCTGQENEGGSQLGAENKGHEAAQTLLEIVALAAAAAAAAVAAAAATAAAVVAAAAAAAAAPAAVQPRGPTPTIAGTASLSARAPNQRGRLAIPGNSIQQWWVALLLQGSWWTRSERVSMYPSTSSFCPRDTHTP